MRIKTIQERTKMSLMKVSSAKDCCNILGLKNIMIVPIRIASSKA